MFTFKSEIQLGSFLPDFTQEQIKNEIMLFNCDLFTATQLAGPITSVFLNTLPNDWKEAPDLVIDSRVHMLMKDFFFPCIPGWHHDDVPRSSSNGQPNYHNPEYRSQHVMALANGEICPTQFALGEANFPEINSGQVYYKIWHPIVESKIQNGELELFSAPSNRLIFFDDRSWHQGIKAIGNGWRWFVRASRNTNRKPTNEIRRQVQVYLENPMDGW